MFKVGLFLVFMLAAVKIGHTQETYSSEVVFTIDLSQQKIPAHHMVGIRGSAPPLNWNSSIPMVDTDSDGIYEANITFTLEPDEREVSYKFVLEAIQRQSDEVTAWDMDRYGPFSNRTIQLRGGKQYAPPAVWDEFDDRQRWMASEMHAIWTLNTLVKSAQKNGKTPQELGKDMGVQELDNWNYVLDAKSMFLGIAFDLNAYPKLQIEMLQSGPELVQYRTNRPFKAFLPPQLPLEMINPNDLQHCIDAMYQWIAKEKGLSYKVEMTEEERLVTIQKL